MLFYLSIKKVWFEGLSLNTSFQVVLSVNVDNIAIVVALLGLVTYDFVSALKGNSFKLVLSFITEHRRMAVVETFQTEPRHIRVAI